MLIRGKDIHLAFGAEPLLDAVNFTINTRDRIALVGRNGVGKSTFLKLLDQQIIPDQGDIQCAANLIVSFLSQDIPQMSGSVREIVSQPLRDHFDHLQLEKQVSKTLSLMSLNGDDTYQNLSGGMKRRILLARALVTEPNLLLLDEPTNHLDITAISWLENFLIKYEGSLIFISHDRQFIQNLGQKIYNLDRGQLTVWDCPYDRYLQRYEEHLNTIESQQKQFDKKLAQEEAWMRKGIKARRTRNEGRVRALLALRREKQQQRKRQGNAKLNIESIKKSGKIVIEANDISFSFQDKNIIANFSTIISRGDKIGIIGPNGCGKTTLIQLLLQQQNPISGEVNHGTNLEIAYFDQLRSQIDDEASVLENVAEGQTHIIFQKHRMHIMGYLQAFLFPPERARTPAKSLSGGERNRLLLAKLFTKPANLLVLDEPTNDLDIETLELLEEVLSQFPGTVLITSHDRAFINNVVTSTFVFEGNGLVLENIGGYDDYSKQAKKDKPTKTDKPIKINNTRSNKQKKKLSYKDQRELDELPNKIESLETEIDNIQQQLLDPNIYQNQIQIAENLRKKLHNLEESLNSAYARWEHLESEFKNY